MSKQLTFELEKRRATMQQLPALQRARIIERWAERPDKGTIPEVRRLLRESGEAEVRRWIAVGDQRRSPSDNETFAV